MFNLLKTSLIYQSMYRVTSETLSAPGSLSKFGTMLSQSEGHMLLDIMGDHGLEQMVHFPTRDKTPWT